MQSWMQTQLVLMLTLRHCVLQVLSAAADALAAQRRPDDLRTVVGFADALPAHVPQAIYRELNRALNRTLS